MKFFLLLFQKKYWAVLLISAAVAFLAALSEIVVAIQIPILILDGEFKPPSILKEFGFDLYFGSLKFFLVSVSLALIFRTMTLASNIVSGMFLGHLLFKNSHKKMKMRSNNVKDITEKELPISLLQVKNHAVVNSLIIPLITILSNSLISVSFVIVLVLFDGFSVIIFGLIIASLYLAIMLGVNSYVNKFATQFYYYTDKFLGGIKNFYENLFEIHGFQLDTYFTKKLEEHDVKIRKYHSYIQIIEQFPRILIDLVVFLTIGWIAFAVDSQVNPQIELQIIILSIYSAMRLLPLLNGIYANLMKVSRASPAAKEILFLNNMDLMNTADLGFDRIHRIEAKNIEKKIKTKTVFSNVNFVAERGDIIGVVGRSGSGKSTLAKIIGGVEELSGGALIFNNGIHLNAYDKFPILKKIVHVKQTPVLFEGDVFVNLGLLDNIDKSAVETHLEFLGIEEIKDHNYGNDLTTLSVGMQQRLGLLRAYFSDADVLILDEITSALDDESEKLAINYISEYLSDRIVFLISHKKEPLKICDRCIYL